MCLLYDSSSTKHFVLGLSIVTTLFSFGVALAGLGEKAYRLSTCQVEPALSLWMMTAGVSLMLTTTLAFIVLVCNKSTKAEEGDEVEEEVESNCCCVPNMYRARRSILTLGWAFCCGIILVFWYMICFSLWIAGSYLCVVTIQKMRQLDPIMSREHHPGCARSVIGVSSSSVIVVWTVFFCICCRIVYRICDNSLIRDRVEAAEGGLEMFANPRPRKGHQTTDSQGNIYDQVNN